jgi:hypothetical protein
MPAPYGEDSVEEGEGGTVTLLCREPKGWTARKAATLTTSEHPGTAVVWEGALWEVLLAEPRKSGFGYRLAPWDERHVVRVRLAYDAASEEARIREAARQADATDLRRLILAAAPLTGLMPSSVQRRWEGELGVPAVRLTILSTAIPFVIGTTCFVLVLAAAFGGGGVPFAVAAAAWFFPESVVRFGLAMSQAIPVGSVPGYLFWYVWRGIASRR